jgi:translation initiation factor 2 subunit 1
VILIVELPDEGELVVAVIKKIMPYGAFCQLPEYGNLEAFLHVSEVAPRWIKNIHEFISEGQRHIVKVHHVDKEKNQVDISIKRVSEEEKKLKIETAQNEKRGTKLLELALEAAKATSEMAAVRKEIENNFDDVYVCFREASFKGEDALKKLEIPKNIKAKIMEIAVKSIKKPIVEINKTISLTCYNADGVTILKTALTLGDDVLVHYLGAPRYQISLTAPDYKSAEKKMAAVLDKIEAYAQKNNCDFKQDDKE